MKPRNMVVISGAVAPILASEAFAQWGWTPGWQMGPGMMGSLGWVGWIFHLAFWVLIIVGLVFLIKWLVQLSRGGGSPGGSPPSSRALEILRERYARGEITKDEFDRMKRDLRD